MLYAHRSAIATASAWRRRKRGRFGANLAENPIGSGGWPPERGVLPAASGRSPGPIEPPRAVVPAVGIVCLHARLFEQQPSDRKVSDLAHQLDKLGLRCPQQAQQAQQARQRNYLLVYRRMETRCPPGASRSVPYAGHRTRSSRRRRGLFRAAVLVVNGSAPGARRGCRLSACTQGTRDSAR